MANMRVVFDNAADRATLSASTTAGGLVVTNLLTDLKSEVWRSTSTSATITATWATGETLGMVALPFCSLTSEATIRVRGYTLVGDITPALDTGAQLACPATAFGTWDWGVSPLGVNAYLYGGGTYGVIWFTHAAFEKIVIDIVDATNPLGYIEAARLVTGLYWEPVNNADYGASVSVVDTSRSERNDAGDLITDKGTLHKALSFDLGFMTANDRNALMNIVRRNGMSRPLFVSLVPQADDPSEEQAYQIYGKMSAQTSIRFQFVNQYSSKIEIEES